MAKPFKNISLKNHINPLHIALCSVCWIFFALNATPVYADCKDSQLSVTILGSGGPELAYGRASSSYWVRDGEKSLFLVDAGSGSAANLVKAGGSISDLEAILLTHLHVDHVNDLPVMIKQSFFTGRQQDLNVFGPSGNALVPSITSWLQRHFDTNNGAYAYLSNYLNPQARSAYKIKPVVVSAELNPAHHFEHNLAGYQISAIAVSHGAIPALAWKVSKNGCSVVFSGDTNNQGNTLAPFLTDVDWLIMHNAIPENADPVAKRLHVTPSQIGTMAKLAHVKHLVLSHIMRRSENRLAETRDIIRHHYQGPISVANDLAVYQLNE